MKQNKIRIVGLLLGLSIPLQALAYFTPEDVLLSKDFFLPPTPREVDARIEEQYQRSEEARLIREAELVTIQEEEEIDILDEETAEKSAAPEIEMTEREMEIWRAVQLLDARESRLLDRIDDRQRTQEFQSRYGTTHGGAPLAPTGAGGILTAITMIGAVAWTIRRAKRSEAGTRKAI
ncbi:hypothetical protein HOD24_04655 [Candidatus Peregrinibacteria bacterium]|nr:hypothetical protein [Candidatus Peregrinibacteria bacterium]MBT4367650.1 hypothetical protein [Candidatus Peregrinibacteria bacterium]MBT4586200.1 hypothetical protein [Candidatus Peregrinibacteria bacterium]MBT6730493.1 hypothetical protein [Candidatus Peregrinibacteria bacterium]MBT7009397.1 hypothetical protein [Candidatus Peregrinibacteria bacterium]